MLQCKKKRRENALHTHWDRIGKRIFLYLVWKDWKRSAVLKVKFSVQTLQRHGSMPCSCARCTYSNENGRVKPFLSLFTEVIIIIFGAMPRTLTQFVMSASGACVCASVCFSIASSFSVCIFECQCNYDDAWNGCPHSNWQTKLQQRLAPLFSFIFITNRLQHI